MVDKSKNEKIILKLPMLDIDSIIWTNLLAYQMT